MFIYNLFSVNILFYTYELSEMMLTLVIPESYAGFLFSDSSPTSPVIFCITKNYISPCPFLSVFKVNSSIWRQFWKIRGEEEESLSTPYSVLGCVSSSSSSSSAPLLSRKSFPLWLHCHYQLLIFNNASPYPYPFNLNAAVLSASANVWIALCSFFWPSVRQWPS